MSYALRYYGTFKNYYDETITVNIYKNGYSGSSEEVKFLEGSECIVSYPGDDDNIYNPIFGSQAKVTMISETDFQYIELHTSNSRDYKLDILKAGNLDWRGWVLPDLFSEPYIAPPYPVTITARCGLGELKETDMPETMTKLLTGSSLVIDISNFVNLYTIIGNALLSIETDLDLNDCINVHHELSATTNDSALYDTYIDLASYKDLSYYDAISDILKTFGARLYQQNGEWWITRVKELEDILSVRKWDIRRPINNSFTLTETKLTTFQIGKPVDSPIVNNSPSLDILPAWKEFNIIQKTERKGSLLKNSDFSEWTNLYDDNRDEAVDFELKEWESDDLDKISLKYEEDGTPLAYLPTTDLTSTPQSEPPIKISQTINNINVTVSQRFRFKFQIKLYAGSGGTTGNVIIKIKTNGLPFDYYLDLNSDGETEWKTTSFQSFIEIEDIPVGRLNKPTSWENIQITTPGVLSEGSLTVEIYGLSKTNLLIKEASCQILDRNEVQYPDTETKFTVVNSDNIYKPDDVEVIGGDLQDIANNRHIWKNFYAESDGKPTVDWNEIGESEDYQLLKILANDYKKRLSTPQFKLSIPILSQTIQFDSCIVDYQVLPKKYICNSAELNYRTNIFKGVYMEFAAWEGADWILEDGTWNDDGIWIDSETWNDTDPVP